jgi:hypothetical protein
MKAARLLLAVVLAQGLAGATYGAEGDDPPVPYLAGSNIQGVEPEEHCVVVVRKVQPGESLSRIKSLECYDTEMEAEASPLLAASILIMTWYKDINFGGSSTRITGSDGPCDTLGYGISNVPPAWWGISSFKSWNRCNVVQAFLEPNYGGLRSQLWLDPQRLTLNPALEVSWIGTSYNDRIRSFLLRATK